MSEVSQHRKGAKANSCNANRREKEDRRTFMSFIQFPLVDSIGKVVKKDRRFIPDRRIANIQVKGHFLHIKRKSLKINEVI